MKLHTRLTLWMLALAAAFSMGAAQAKSQSDADGDDDDTDSGGSELIGHSRNSRAGFAPSAGSSGTNSVPITHHGGPVMATPTVYVIWYGNWNQSNGSDNPAGKQTVTDFLNSIGGSPYYRMNTNYSISGTQITGNVVYGGSIVDSGSQGTRLSDSKVWSIVQRSFTNGLPKSTNAIYFVLSSSDCSESSGFCLLYCGWHSNGNSSGSDIKYSFVGNAKRCLSGCAAQGSSTQPALSPNSNAGVDGMISVIAHELVETVSDPDLNAWYDSKGAENADKCAWTFGSQQYQVANGSWANMRLGTRDYLIQRNLFHTVSGDYCIVGFNGTGGIIQ